ncbi:Prefoldin [Lipomyces oligophaga]|uniref:Prefoldin n=1 Tax=Lipomyces oligophaga TaxID=45792 RepID=UPI0034CFF1C7
MAAKEKTVDLGQLSVQQLSEVKSQLEQELETLSQSFQKLRQAQTKFRECIVHVEKTAIPTNKGNSLLVPLTSSLYLPGKLADVETFLVDVGTGYYVEKKPKDAIKFYESKVTTLQQNMADLENIVNNKSGNLRTVDEVLRKKMLAATNAASSPST